MRFLFFPERIQNCLACIFSEFVRGGGCSRGKRKEKEEVQAMGGGGGGEEGEVRISTDFKRQS